MPATMTMTATTLQRRLHCFVGWIKTDPDRNATISRQLASVRTAISAKAREDGLVVVATPDSGSFAKGTGLRRHFRGHAEVEGQDVDAAFVVRAKTEEGDVLRDLLARFERYAASCYPTTERCVTKSSVRLTFSATTLSFDLVPLLEVSGSPDEQILIRSTGERRRTSLRKHIVFVTGRTARSGALPFKAVVRHLKWWAEICVGKDDALEEVPSTLLELLAARAFESRGARATYAETLADWFGYIGNIVKRRERVAFLDFTPTLPAPNANALWEVLDPANAENNVVSGWTRIEVDTLATWLAEARDAMSRAIARDLKGDDSGSLAALVDVFGTPIEHHCGDDE